VSTFNTQLRGYDFCSTGSRCYGGPLKFLNGLTSWKSVCVARGPRMLVPQWSTCTTIVCSVQYYCRWPFLYCVGLDGWYKSDQSSTKCRSGVEFCRVENPGSGCRYRDLDDFVLANGGPFVLGVGGETEEEGGNRSICFGCKICAATPLAWSTEPY
jgi:hypothetical protein